MINFQNPSITEDVLSLIYSLEAVVLGLRRGAHEEIFTGLQSTDARLDLRSSDQTSTLH